MAKSFRLYAELERRLIEASALEGVSASDFIRDAVRRRCDETLGSTLLDGLGEIVGSVAVGGNSSLRTGRAFTEELRSAERRRRE